MPRKRPTKIVPAHVMDAKYLVVDQPSTMLGILVGRACTLQPPDGRSKPTVQPVAGKLTGSILIGFESVG